MNWQHNTEASASYDDNEGYYVYSTSLYIAPDRSVIVSGFARNGKIDFDSDGQADLLIPAIDSFVAHYDEEGNLIDTFSLNQVESSNSNHILINHLFPVGPTEFVVSGVLRGRVHLNPEMPEEMIQAEGDQDAILVRYSIGDTPLPVELVFFNVTTTSDTAHLQWQTSSETNNAGFVVLQNGEEVAFVEGAGTTSDPQTYKYSIGRLPAGDHVFQLKQVDFDGSFSMSEEVVASIQFNELYTLTQAFPNPFNPRSRFSLTLAQGQEVKVTLFDMLGRNVQTLFEGSLNANQLYTFIIDGSSLSSGTYIYRVEGAHFQARGQVILLK